MLNPPHDGVRNMFTGLYVVVLVPIESRFVLPHAHRQSMTVLDCPRGRSSSSADDGVISRSVDSVSRAGGICDATKVVSDTARSIPSP
jgi:hypothetical protein